MLSKSYNIVPVFREITADLLTPVLAFSKIRGNAEFPFLLESVESIGRLARYSFIGKDPYKIIFGHGKQSFVTTAGKTEKSDLDIFEQMKLEIGNFNYPKLDDLPNFTGGYVGYIGYENISLVEDVLEFTGQDELGIPDSIMALYRDLIVFDHYKHKILIISNIFVDEHESADLAYNFGLEKIASIRNKLVDNPGQIGTFKTGGFTEPAESDRDNFFKAVEKAKQHIYEGDIFQIVLSKRFSTEYSGDLLNVYRALRMINPSPYMYYLDFGKEISIIGTSPEDLLSVQKSKAAILPIAGTRRRGKTEEEDQFLEDELLNDPKEIAEHVMLVDLARNDLGRICDYNSISLVEDKKIHKFSHVMHIVSRVEGALDEKYDVIDALKACFPAGTVSGAPKIKAMQLINKYENLKRNVYAGSIGYIDFRGNMDMCIAIRTLYAKNNKIFWQAGAGIVADSQPHLELKEIFNKSAVLVKSLKFAGEIDEDRNN